MTKDSQQSYIDSCYELFFDNKKDFATYCLKAKSLWFDISKDSKAVASSSDKILTFIHLYKEGLSLFERISKFMTALNKEKINLYKYIYHWTTLKRIKLECEDETIKNICSQKHELQVFLSKVEFSMYARWFETNFFRYDNHLLDDQSKKLLEEMSYGDLIDKVYQAMLNSDIKPKVLNTLTIQERQDLYSLKCSDKAYEVIRKLVWLDLSNEFFLHAETMTALLFNKISFYNLISTKKNFTNAIEENIYSYELNSNLFSVLSKSSQQFKNCNIHFKQIEKNATIGCYNLHTFEPWDVDLSIFTSSHNVTQDQFNKYINKAFNCLGNEYIKPLRAALGTPIKTKYKQINSIGNLYSQTIDGNAHNLILSNEGTIQGLFRAAHCIGHLMNDYFIKVNGKDDINLLQKEISSMVNETLMFLYIRDNVLKSDPYELSNAYYFFLKQLTNIVSLCNMRLVLKDELNKMLELKNLNSDINYSETNALFNRVKKHYEGLIDDEFRWIDNKDLSKLVNIGLLQQTFEQYHLVDDIRYVIGVVVALNISFDIFSGKKSTIDKYIKFLKTGTEISPIDAIKELGINFANNEVYEIASENLKKLILEFKHILIGKNTN